MSGSITIRGHSINFAVWTIAVSDNALANNVIIGGASLAKVFIPIWLIFKTSKLPISKTLKKVSLTGGSLALAGGSYASSFLNSNTNNFSQNIKNTDEINNEPAEINFTQTETETNLSSTSPFQNDEDFLNNPVDDFSLSERKPEMLNNENTSHNKLSFEENNQKSIEQSMLNEQTINQENHINQQSHIQNEISKDFSIENDPQIINETTKSQNIFQSHNETILNDPQSQSLEYEASINEHKQSVFNEEAIHKEDWIDDGENLNRPPQKEKNEMAVISVIGKGIQCMELRGKGACLFVWKESIAM